MPSFIIPNSYGSTSLREFNHYHDPRNGKFTRGSGAAGLIAAAKRNEVGRLRRSAIKHGLVMPSGSRWKPKRRKGGLLHAIGSAIAQRMIGAMYAP